MGCTQGWRCCCLSLNCPLPAPAPPQGPDSPHDRLPWGGTRFVSPTRPTAGAAASRAHALGGAGGAWAAGKLWQHQEETCVPWAQGPSWATC